MNELNCMATCRLGLESVVAAELRGQGAQEVRAKNARVDFWAAPELLARANLWLRASFRQAALSSCLRGRALCRGRTTFYRTVSSP